MVKWGQAGYAWLIQTLSHGPVHGVCREGTGHETAYGHVIPNALGVDLRIMRYIPWPLNGFMLPRRSIIAGTWYTMLCMFGVTFFWCPSHRPESVRNNLTHSFAEKGSHETCSVELLWLLKCTEDFSSLVSDHLDIRLYKASKSCRGSMISIDN